MDTAKTRDVEIKIRVVAPTAEKPDGYIGVTSHYPPRDGETHSRGNDLADGALTPETLDQVFADIGAVSRGYRNAYDEDGGEGEPVNLPGGPPRPIR